MAIWMSTKREAFNGTAVGVQEAVNVERKVEQGEPKGNQVARTTERVAQVIGAGVWLKVDRQCQRYVSGRMPKS